MRTSLTCLIAAMLLLDTACSRSCGDYEHQTGLEWGLADDGDPPDRLDDYRLFELCGAGLGSFGSEDFEEGAGWILFDGFHRDPHISQITSGIQMDLYFNTSSLAVGRSLEIRDEASCGDTYTWSRAYVVTANGGGEAGATFTRGEIEVLDVDDQVDPISGRRSWRLRWDLTWGEPGESEFWYTAVGEDWLPLTVAGND